MSLCRNGLVLCVIMVMMCMCVEVTRGGVVYKVGESSGWNNVGRLNYMGWARNKTFHVGDKIVFEYNRTFHNVLRVTHKAFDDCNATAPMTTYNSGNDTFNIWLAGHYFFICGIPGHCQAGQKVDIRVPRSISSAPANSPSSLENIAPDNSPSSPEFPKVPSTSPTSESLVTPAPAPAKSNASIFGINNMVLLSLFVLVCFV